MRQAHRSSSERNSERRIIRDCGCSDRPCIQKKSFLLDSAPLLRKRPADNFDSQAN
ncbi:hypothetical protein HMPREF9371_0839 [Neisseria shayeganii 871]|uniref:Uncharacterized protein n=1 Tax=Neisseria shayeganii 871 TaxID=1032488 RepID=G4CGV0_9NEIS|nr:hypothetical protein HMPREF9371_0839 [Neisseria shayeganii 871]